MILESVSNDFLKGEPVNETEAQHKKMITLNHGSDTLQNTRGNADLKKACAVYAKALS